MKTLLIGMLMLAGLAEGARPTATLDSTALSLHMRENPKAELSTPETLKAVANIKEELKAILDKHVVSVKHEEFFLPEPYEFGVVLVRLNDAAYKTVEPLLAPDGTLDVSKSIGLPAVDALNRKWNITKYTKNKWSTHFRVEFDKGINPQIVADSFGGAADVKWAQANGLRAIGGGTDVRRIAPVRYDRNYGPTIYVLSIGWGDCPAGCMAINRRYFEVRTSELDPTSVKHVGQGGAPLDAATETEYYK